MPVLAIPFPTFFDPIALQIGPVAIHWYALAYIVGFLIGWRYCRRLAGVVSFRPDADDFDDFLAWAIIGTILGGRLGYVFFYNAGYYLQNPLEILATWQGGMAFHGGLLGVIGAMLLFAWRRGFGVFALSDLVAAAAPIGLFLGRVANFVNGELWGRPTDVPWGVIFPAAGPEPRHPSQLYEAILEGLVLFVVLWLLARRPDIRRRPGVVTGVFLIGYGTARFVVEFFRQPDAQLGFLWLGATMGQILSLPMILGGAAILAWALARRPLQA